MCSTYSIPSAYREEKQQEKHTPKIMSINVVVDVKPFKTMWKIKVKAIRLWKQYSTAGDETIEMVFCNLKVWCLKRVYFHGVLVLFIKTDLLLLLYIYTGW